MTDPHEDLVEAVGNEAIDELIGRRGFRQVWDEIDDETRAEIVLAVGTRVVALIAERTKDATPEMCNEWGRDWEHEGTSPENDWFHMHRASALWPKEKP